MEIEHELKIPSMAGKNVLITGGCGFLGSTLAERLVKDGAEVSIFILPNEDESNILEIKQNLKIFSGSLLDEKLVEEALSGKDYLFHFAWQTDLKKSMENPKQDIQQDILSLVTLLESCRMHNSSIKIVFPSTVTLFGVSEEIHLDESAKENPLSAYDINKLTAEKYLLMYNQVYGLKTTILRLANVFGEKQKINNPSRGVLNFMIGKALKGEDLSVYGDGKFIRDYSYVQNYLDAFILSACLEQTNGQVFVLGTGEGRDFNEVVETIKKTIKEMCNINVNIIHVPFPKESHQINQRNFIANSDKLKKATGWFPRVSFYDGLRRTIEFHHVRNAH